MGTDTAPRTNDQAGLYELENVIPDSPIPSSFVRSPNSSASSTQSFHMFGGSSSRRQVDNAPRPIPYDSQDNALLSNEGVGFESSTPSSVVATDGNITPSYTQSSQNFPDLPPVRIAEDLRVTRETMPKSPLPTNARVIKVGSFGMKRKQSPVQAIQRPKSKSQKKSKKRTTKGKSSKKQLSANEEQEIIEVEDTDRPRVVDIEDPEFKKLPLGEQLGIVFGGKHCVGKFKIPIKYILDPIHGKMDEHQTRDLNKDHVVKLEKSYVANNLTFAYQ